jgi:hypothetical protein
MYLLFMFIRMKVKDDLDGNSHHNGWHGWKLMGVNCHLDENDGQQIWKLSFGWKWWMKCVWKFGFNGHGSKLMWLLCWITNNVSDE